MAGMARHGLSLNRRDRRLRRQLLKAASGYAALAVTPIIARASAHWRPQRDPFSLGVASGYPRADGFVLWTRLAPTPLLPGGGVPPEPVAVHWEIAHDERFTRLAQSGNCTADPRWAHSVHVEVRGLASARPYWYRFRCGDARSAVGRAATTPVPGAPLGLLAFALACCQNYEHGYYNAYRHMAGAGLDLVVHVGDYIYEHGPSPGRVRSHVGGECLTLEDYRIRHALYRTDPDVQAAHAACPWLLVWDDHDVSNDYAGDVSELGDPPLLFRARRAAAYRAYYEHLPLPSAAAPRGANARMYRTADFGTLAQFQLLDERQYRSPQACPLPGRRGSNRVGDDCTELWRADRTMLGQVQEQWLGERLARSHAQWNFLTQGVAMAHLDEQPGPGRRYWTDAWNGYPAARARLLQQVVESRVSNPVVLSGDAHAFIVSDLNRTAKDPATPVVASELLTTSISSDPPPESMIQGWLPENPNVRFATGKHRGYVRVELRPQALRATLMAMDTVTSQDPAARSIKSFTLESGRPGLQDG
jgi:alkaline phosphatase D